ncbi:MAG TPA: hypothetical protein VFP59_16445 [Candidatus Angelobacter sp.]|nr:hypothetical protein [Candidatus Angelobacter sp.]
MYITLFSELLGKLNRAKLPLDSWRNTSIQNKAVVSVVTVAVLTLGLGGVAILSRWVYLCLLPLGIFYGVVLSYPITRFFGPKLQSLATGFLGGITIENIGTQQAKLSAYITAVAGWIKAKVTTVIPAGSARMAKLDNAIMWAVWTAILVCLAILAVNAYYANKEGNPVGQLDRPGQPEQPAIAVGQPRAAHAGSGGA